MEITQFNATIYFKTAPLITKEKLIEAWGREGYTCEADECEHIFKGFRGGTHICLESPQPADTDDFPEDYPEITEIDIDYDKTYLINHKAGFSDFKSSQFQMDLTFRIVEDLDSPIVAHNEFLATLLGIHQVAPITAICLHDLGVIAGFEDIDDYTSYADSSVGSPQFAPTFAFGTLIAKSNNTIKAWTTGLEHFNHKNIFIEDEYISPLDAMRVIFNTGYQITSKYQFEAGETMESGEIFCKIEDGMLFGEAALKFVRIS
jgi:hypothetical protein